MLVEGRGGYVGGGVRRVCWWRGEEGMLVEG